ncbi:MAG: zinc-binding dehydrogenase [Candidatus Poribacteria bacterium]|nr:zinc-binding dehydrogenase [Candidatus Poribacteria bacterium]
MIEAHRIIFPRELQACLERYAFEDSAEHENEIIIETAFSTVSSGSELVAFTGDYDMGVMPFSKTPGDPYPAFPGYATVGTIIDLGDGVKGFDLGDMVFVAKGHASHHRADVTTTSVIKVPDDVPPQEAVYVRFCAVSMATLRTTAARPGDGVAVFGLGVVGTMAAQIFQVSGYEVVGIDPVDARRRGAECCGVRHTLLPSEDLSTQWTRTLGDTPCKLALEVSGTPHATHAAIQLASTGAEVVLIGGPWKRSAAFSMSDLLQPIFLKYLRLRSGWELELPEFPAPFRQGSTVQNLQYAMNLFARGQIKVAPLRSHVLSPLDAEGAFLSLLNEKETCHSVVFDWANMK